MPPFRDDHILIISPGSLITSAQLGLPESFTPPKLRFPSRMFPGLDPGTWTFTKIREAGEGERDALIAQKKEQDRREAEAAGEEAEEDDDLGEGVFVEDEDDEEGAVWCIKEGKVVNWEAFFALLQHVHEMINPTFHTPLLMTYPTSFSFEDKELLTQFVFEKLKVPGFALVESATAALWAYGIPTATVIDIGYEKTDITPISEFLIQERAKTTVYNAGGETMTRYLSKLLPDMKPDHVEAMKKSPVCEIPLPGTPLPGGIILRAEDEGGEKDDEMMDEESGTVNVAAIVASGKTHEFLSKKEKERRGEEERKLPNREREINTFWAIDKKLPEEEDVHSAPLSAVDPPPSAELLTSPTTEFDPKKNAALERRKQEKRAAAEGIYLKEDEIWREISVGTARFRAADCGIFHSIADGLFYAISRVEEVQKRADLWDSLIIVGNASRIRGFKDALLHTIAAKYLIPPSGGTIFNSELPSSMSTPVGTGANTPQPYSQSQPKPLLVAATTANLPSGGAHGHHSSHGQTPMSIKTAKAPEYFPEWKESGMEEAVFLGAQVCAKVLFVVDQGTNKGFMTRVEYNEKGPEGIHDVEKGDGERRER